MFAGAIHLQAMNQILNAEAQRTRRFAEKPNRNSAVGAASENPFSNPVHQCSSVVTTGFSPFWIRYPQSSSAWLRRAVSIRGYPLPDYTIARSDVKRPAHFPREHGNEWIAPIRIGFDAAQDHAFQIGRQIRIQFAPAAVFRAVSLPRQDVPGRVTRKRFLIGEQFIGSHAEGENIHAMRDRLALQLFWGPCNRGCRGFSSIASALAGIGCARSKSISRTLALCVTRTFSGLKSRCMNPFSCMCSRPRNHVDQDLRHVFRQHRIVRAYNSFKFDASTYSISR